jgi:uncharacterized protein (TIGR00255 family)
MTGFGEAHRQDDHMAVGFEIRTINSRYFKMTLRSSEGYSVLEAQIESVVRRDIKRGTVQVSLRVDRTRSADDYRINASVLAGYRRQLEELARDWPAAKSVSVEHLLLLPGVVNEHAESIESIEEEWPLIGATLEAAMENLAGMRAGEGRAMAADLRANCQTIAKELAAIEERAPQVISAYRARLEERLKKALADYEVSLNAGDLIREVSIYAERSDISEEIVRLRSHLEQFDAFMNMEESAGRKLEFLTQEMYRETNTIGSKANDVEIQRHVIEIKAAIERVREMIQNVE